MARRKSPKANPRTEPQEVPLDGRLQEFRIALREEIEASKKNASSSAVPLVNGRRIGQVGSRFQYTFEIENILNLPGDAPGDLLIENRAPLEVDVIAVDGLSIVLSLPENVGAAIPFARLQSNLTFLMRKLITRIEAMADKSNLVGDRILYPSSFAGTPVSVSLPQLNSGQTRAVSCSIGRNVTFIWGPPGTGKTHTIGTLAEQLYSRSRSVLLVSHTNTAVDQALLHISRALSSAPASSAQLDAGKVLRVGDPRDQRLAEQPRLLLETHIARRSAELTARRQSCETQLQSVSAEAIRLANLITLYEWVHAAKSDIDAMRTELDDIHSLEKKARSLSDQHRQLLSSSAQWSTAVAAAQEAMEWLQRMEVLQGESASAQSELDRKRSAIGSYRTELSESERILQETTNCNWLVRAWKGLPKPEEQQKAVTRMQGELAQMDDTANAVEKRLHTLNADRAALDKSVEAFKRLYRDSPSNVLHQAQEREKQLRELSAESQHSLQRANANRVRLESTLRDRVHVIEQMRDASEPCITAEEMLKTVEKAYAKSQNAVRNLDIRQVRSELETANATIQRLQAEIAEIDEKLKTVEQAVIAEATIVATTLTRAYLRDTIQARRFDTVILDEASMAPIPALWIAASIANANAVLVGDFKQLPPIVQSTHPLAKKWLGRDVFEVADLTSSDGCPPFPDILCPLFEQRRMHPAISAIPNTFVYHRQLQDCTSKSDDPSMSDYFSSEHGLDGFDVSEAVEDFGRKVWRVRRLPEMSGARGTTREKYSLIRDSLRDLEDVARLLDEAPLAESLKRLREWVEIKSQPRTPKPR